MADLTAARLVFDPGLRAGVRRERRVIVLPGGEIPADTYRPAGAEASTSLATVLFIHGDASAEDLADVLDWGQYRSWGEAVADRGLCAVVIQHRPSDGLRHAAALLAQVRAAIDALRGDAVPGIDGTRLGIWTCSAGSSFGVTAGLLADPPVSFVVSYYGFLDVRHLAPRLDPGIPPSELAAVSPAAVVEGIVETPPTLIVRAGLDYPELNESIDRYLAAARGRGEIRVEEHPAGHHGFDVMDADERSRELIALTLDYMAEKLTARSSSPDRPPRGA